jgi:transcriptional repressor NF-X1
MCRKPLRCGNHTCEQLCHPGHCPPCINMIVDDIVCPCGGTVLQPPQSCGTKPPICKLPCRREHVCDHPVTHTCHYQEQCPPCPVLVTRLCAGGHGNKCSSTPCHVTNPTCLQPCGKFLRCGTHLCPLRCHAGDCQEQIPREMMAAPLPAALPSLAPSAWDDAPAPGAASGTDPMPVAASHESCGLKVCSFLKKISCRF